MTDKQIDSLRQAFMKDKDRSDGECPMSDQVAAYAFGELDPEQAAKVEAHLQTCRQCLDLVMEIRLAEQEAEELKDQKVEVLPGLQKAINEAKAPRASILSKIVRAISDFLSGALTFKPVPAFATAAIIIIAGAIMLRGPGETPAPYAIEILMHGRTQTGFRGGQPEYKQFQVQSGGTMQSGDYFRFQTKVDKPAFIYAVFLDSAGKIESLERGQVPGGQEIFIPEGDQWFQLDKHTGIERLFILATEEAIEDFSQKVDALRADGIEKIQDLFPEAKIQAFSFAHQ